MRTLFLLLSCLCPFLSAAEIPARWWKGNLHTHSLWSDGDDYPEMIVEWYKNRGYHFLALSDHNILSDEERWISVAKKGGELAFLKYLERFGSDWVEVRAGKDDKEVRLKRLSEFRVPFEEPERFLMIQSEEITGRSIHVNATNIQEIILPYSRYDPKDSTSVVKALQRTINAVMEQRERTGVPMFPHVNHPNFKWALTAEELIQLEHERFFEVYNGHTDVRNEGDELHAGVERVWDIILTERLSKAKEVVFGLATDDSHQYHNEPRKTRRPGRGWVMVRASALKVENLIAAMEAGDFYASSGVSLKEVRREGNQLSLEIDAEPGIVYTIEFIGTRVGYDAVSDPVLDELGEPLRVTRRYSADVGTILATTSQASASYTLKGDEIYVRARVTSSKVKENPYRQGEHEQAWTQPLIGARHSRESD